MLVGVMPLDAILLYPMSVLHCHCHLKDIHGTSSNKVGNQTIFWMSVQTKHARVSFLAGEIPLELRGVQRFGLIGSAGTVSQGGSLKKLMGRTSDNATVDRSSKQSEAPLECVD